MLTATEKKALENFSEIEFPSFNNDKTEDEQYGEHFKLFTDFQTIKNQFVRHLSKDGFERNILDYILDSTDRMNERKIKPSWKEDYQANLFEPVTRSKLISILSVMAQSRMKAEPLVKRQNIFVVDDVDLRQSIYSNLLDNANEHNMDDYQIIFEMFTGLSEGTVIGYEGWMKGKIKYESPIDFNPDTGEIKTETVEVNEWDDVYGELIPVEEFFPETIWVNAKDFYTKVKRTFRAREMTLDNFKSVFGGYPGADEVKASQSFMVDETLPYGIPADTHPNNVFVLEFYDSGAKKKGLWVNGKKLYFGPLPFIHGQQPFWISIGEPIHQGFLFGKSLPDKLMGMQDITNGLLNAMLDQLFMALNSPIFVDGMEDLADGYLEPGRMYELAPGGKVERVNLGQVDQTSFQMYSLLKRSMEESSISSQSQGVSSGGRKTKYEVQQLQDSSLQLAGLFLQLMEQAMKRKYWLRMYNLLQYYSMPSQQKSGKKRFKFIEIDNVKLTNGKRGKRRIQIVGSKTDVPHKDNLANLITGETGESYNAAEAKIQPIVITRDWLINKELDLEMSIIPNSSVKDSKTGRKNSDIAFYQATINNPLFDKKEISADFARAFGKDPATVLAKEEAQPQGAMPGLPGLPGMKGTPATSTPQIDTSML